MKFHSILIFLILVCSIFNSCINDFQLPENQIDDNRIILQSFICQDSLISIRVNTFDDNISSFDLLDIVLFDREIPIDTFQRISENEFRSSVIIAELASQDQITLQVFKSSELIFESNVLNFPSAPLVTYSALTDTLLNNPSIVNFERKGEFSILNDDHPFKAGLLELSVIDFRNDTLIKDHLPQFLAGANCSEGIFYLRSYSSLDMECYGEGEIDFEYKLVDLNSQETIIGAVFEICNLSEVVANYFNSQPKIFEGTDFFFSPNTPLKFNYENDQVLAIVGELNCKKYITQF